MVRISKMILHNFKTFARKTEIIFGDKFNVIIGPNGSGKSNIMDALCFVLGRASSKSMRAEKSANLIFDGRKTKEKPAQGSVSIFFTNEEKVFPYDFDEIKVTRIIKQNGQSIYKINDKRCTRQEILNLLALAKINPDGYNIILQENIVKIMDMTPLNRRLMLEEVAGINVYEDKKNKALNDLNNVDMRIKEAEIVITERKSYLENLKNDRNQALKYKEIISEINSYKATNLKKKIDKARKNLLDVDAKAKANNDKINGLKSKIEAHKSEIKDKKSQVSDISQQIEQKGEKEQIEINKELEQLKIKEATDKSRLKTCNSEIDKISHRIDESKKEISLISKQRSEFQLQIKAMNSEKENKKSEINEIVVKIKDFEKQLNLKNVTELENKMSEIDQKIEDIDLKLKDFTKQQQDLFREKDRLELSLSSIDAKIDKINKLKIEHQKEIDEINNLKDDFKNTTLKLNSLLKEDSMLSAQANAEKKNLLSMSEEQSKLDMKLSSAKKQIQSDLAVKKILELKSTIRGIHGTISELGSADTKYSKALSVLAGGKGKFIVVDNEEIAVRCVKYLKKNKLGSASFIPLSRIKAKSLNTESESMKNKPGVINFAISVINYDHQFKKAFEYVFGDSLIIDKIESSKSLGVGKIRMVSLDGDLVNNSGVIRGGYLKKVNAVFNDTKIESQLSEINAKIAKSNLFIDDVTKRREDLEKDIRDLRVKKANFEGEIIKKEKALYLDTSDLDANVDSKKEIVVKIKETDKKLEEIEQSIEKLNQELLVNKTEKQKIRAKLSETRNPAKLAELNTYEDNRRLIQSRISEIEAKLSATNTRCEVLDRDLSSLNANIDNSEKEMHSFEEEIKQLNEDIKGSEEKIKAGEEKVKKFYSEFKELFERKNQLENSIQLLDNDIDEIEQKIREIEQRNNLLQLKKVEINGKISGLETQFEEVKDAKILDEEDDNKIEAKLKMYEKELSNIGDVNLKSLEIYDHVQKEYDQLSEKIKTLKSEKEDVVSLINEIDRKKKDLFLKTYGEINANLQKIYPALSRSGKAELNLENREEVFSGGVRISVRQSDEKTIDIKSLSGGEKTLLALAFMFAIEEYEPASFYSFDEIEAHLDKENSELLAKLIRKYSDKAQYILISHNDEIISAANNLYGVSMDQKTGISKLISIKI